MPMDYARPAMTVGPRPPILSVRIAAHAWAIAFATGAIAVLGIPKVEAVFKDFKVELPAITKITLIADRALVNSYLWIPALLVAIALPFGLTALLGVGTPSDEDIRRREMWVCRGLKFLAFLVIGWIALSLLVPYTTLLQSISSPSSKK